MNDRDYSLRVRAMERRLYRISRAILFNDADCADAIQEAVFRGWMKKGSLRDEALFETWIIRILINECRNILRKRKIAPLPLENAIIAGTDAPDEGLHLRQALSRLPEKYRMPLLLHHLEGYGLADIARMLDLPQPLVKSRLHQARGALRRILNAGGENA